jgi:hypothetical protein
MCPTILCVVKSKKSKKFPKVKHSFFSFFSPFFDFFDLAVQKFCGSRLVSIKGLTPALP